MQLSAELRSLRLRLRRYLPCFLLAGLGLCASRRAAADSRSLDAVVWRFPDRMGRPLATRLEPQSFTLLAPEFPHRRLMMRVLDEWALSPAPLMSPCPSCRAREGDAPFSTSWPGPLAQLDPGRLSFTTIYPLRRDRFGRCEQVGAFFPSLTLMPLLGQPGYGLAMIGTF